MPDFGNGLALARNGGLVGVMLIADFAFPSAFAFPSVFDFFRLEDL